MFYISVGASYYKSGFEFRIKENSFVHNKSSGRNVLWTFQLLLLRVKVRHVMDKAVGNIGRHSQKLSIF
jgi:hypothetical protein